MWAESGNGMYVCENGDRSAGGREAQILDRDNYKLGKHRNQILQERI